MTPTFNLIPNHWPQPAPHSMPDATRALEPPRALEDAVHYRGPDRRSDRGFEDLVMRTLDEIDYGMIVLDAGLRVLYVNHRARVDLSNEPILRIAEQRLQACADADAAALGDAIDAALNRRLRRMVMLGAGERRSCVGVIPLPPDGMANNGSVLVVTGRASVCEPLSVQWFARSHGLTPAESDVLVSLCSGKRPIDVANFNGVAISTVRTQIGTIRQKTGAQSILELVREISCLPPLVSALRGTQPQ